MVSPPPAPPDGTSADPDFDFREFTFNGHVVGGWFNANPFNGQGDAGNYPDLQVLFLQLSVPRGESSTGTISVFATIDDELVAFFDQAVDCVAVAGCQGPEECDDADSCTDDFCDPSDPNADEFGCTHSPTDCDDGDACTKDFCDPETGCQHDVFECDDGDACTDDICVDEGGCVSKPIDCNDENACTEDGCDSDTGCTHDDIDCSDGNPCTEDLCAPDTSCTHEDIECPEGQVCDPANGECVEDQDPCECVNGKVTLCHIPPGNPGNAHTITVGCAALDRHLAHGDICGPCE